MAKASGTFVDGTSSEDIATVTDPGKYVLKVDLSDVANGEVVEITISDKVLSGGTTGQLFKGSFSNVQADKTFQSIPVVTEHETVFRIEQVTGSLVSLPWAVVEL